MKKYFKTVLRRAKHGCPPSPLPPRRAHPATVGSSAQNRAAALPRIESIRPLAGPAFPPRVSVTSKSATVYRLHESYARARTQKIITYAHIVHVLYWINGGGERVYVYIIQSKIRYSLVIFVYSKYNVTRNIILLHDQYEFPYLLYTGAGNSYSPFRIFRPARLKCKTKKRKKKI